MRPQRADPRRHSMADYIDNDETGDGVDRRGFLKCMAWAGTGLLCSMSGGVLTSRALAAGAAAGSDLSFVQISDSHIGFGKEANKNVVGTLQAAVDKIN